MSDENEISWPLRKDDLTSWGVLYQVIKETLPYAPNNEIKKFVKELEAKEPIDKEDMTESLKDLEKERGDCFMRTQCREIAKALGVRFV